jgi:hypothetical protein
MYIARYMRACAHAPYLLWWWSLLGRINFAGGRCTAYGPAVPAVIWIVWASAWRIMTHFMFY